MNYNQPPLVLTDTQITDALRTTSLDDLPDPQPACPIRIKQTTPLMERLWRIALSDCERNLIEVDGSRYFGAGTLFGPIVYTRDISYSGILGLNDLYPEIMMDSLVHTRKIRRQLGFKVSKSYVIPEIDAPWEEEADLMELDFVKKYSTNSYTRRTDDVVWLWAAEDLLLKQGDQADWNWLYETGKEFFAGFYAPFFDREDGLYRGQSSFIDVHFYDHQASGYPQGWNTADCVLVKALSTNCLYVKGLQVMANTAGRLKKPETEITAWQSHCDDLKQAIRRELGREDGTYAYFKDRHGNLQDRREALGTSFLIHCDVLSGEDARKALTGHPVTDGGVPLLHPFFPNEAFYHNNSSWPFVDAFFLHAWEKIDGIDRTAQNAALLARSCVGENTFYEVTDYRSREMKVSTHQLWTAAAFIDTCRRAGLYHP